MCDEKVKYSSVQTGNGPNLIAQIVLLSVLKYDITKLVMSYIYD